MTQTAFIIRKAEPKDARLIVGCHHDAIWAKASTFYDEDVLKIWSVITDDLVNKVVDETKNEKAIYLVAEDANGDIIGFALAFPDKHELRAVYTKPNYCGKVGATLLAALIEQAKMIKCAYLECDSSINAEKFYLKQGFRILSRGMHRMGNNYEMACFKMRIDF